MSETVVAKRYADALFQLGKEKDTLNKFEEEFNVVREVFENNAELNTFLMHPQINNEKKKQLLSVAFKGMQADVVNTLKLLVDRHRIAIIPTVIEHFTQLVNDAKGIAEATVYSVRALSDAEKNQLATTFSKRLHKTSIKLTNIVDTSILGGIKIRVGNTIYDGTIGGKLKRIERNITTAN